MLEPAQDLLSEQELYIHHTKCNLKTAIDGSVWAWHQDYGTWKRDGMPEARPTTALVMLDEPTEMNGCLYFIPGSHKEGNLEPEFNDATGYKFYVTPKDKLLEIMARSPAPVAITGKPGTVVFFDCNILHASGHNLSQHNRCCESACCSSVLTCLNASGIASPDVVYLSSSVPNATGVASPGVVFVS